MLLISGVAFAQLNTANNELNGPDSQWLGTSTSTAPLHRIGNVSIGNDSYLDGIDEYKLSVDGKVRANSVKVYTDWADFVFEKDYQLPTLPQIEAFIIEHGHLMDIPSAKEVETEGIELGEMNKLLLQKIEELTLHMIALQKQIIDLKE